MKRRIKRHISGNRKKYLILCMAYVCGMLMGYICLGLFSEETTAALMEYVGENMKTFLSYSGSLDNAGYFTDVLLKEAGEYILMWLSGLSMLGVFFAPVFMLYKGYIFGFACAFMLKSFDVKGLVFDIVVLVSQNMIKFPALIFAGMCTVSHALKRSYLSAGEKNTSVGSLVRVYTVFMLLAFAVHCAGIYMECYIIPHFIFIFAADMV